MKSKGKSKERIEKRKMRKKEKGRVVNGTELHEEYVKFFL